jgi:hypothetical protein
MVAKDRRVREHDVATEEPVEDDDDAEGSFLSGRCAPLVRGAVGLAYPFAEGGAQVFGRGGVAVDTRDTENTSLFADIGKNFDRGFLGAGVGVWDFTHSDTVGGSVFVHGGFNMTDRLQWSFEGRFLTSELDHIENN